MRESQQIVDIYKKPNTFCVCQKRLRYCWFAQIFNILYFCVHSEDVEPVWKQVSDIKTGTVVVGVKCIVVVCVSSLIIYRVIMILYSYPVIGDDSFRMTWLSPG